MTDMTKTPNSEITEIELVYQNKKPVDALPTVTNSYDASKILMQSWDKNKMNLQEQFKVLLLNNAGKALGVSTVGVGGLNGVYVDLRAIFGLAIKANASGIIAAHNHPSGVKKFSESDIHLTKHLTEAGSILGIDVHDHLLITEGGYVSMVDSGLFPSSEVKPLPIANDPGNPLPSKDVKSDQPNTPAFYIFNQNSHGEKPVGAVFLHGKGNGFNIVFDENAVIDKTRYVAFPPKPKPEAVVQMTMPKHPVKRRSPGQKS